MFARVERSWNLIKASAAVLRSDKELLLFPVLSAGASLLLILSFALPLVGVRAFADGAEPSPAMLAVGFAFYFSQYFITIFFNAALVAAAMIRLQGGDPTVGDGLRAAWQRIGVIAGYAVLAATVGMVLRAVEERVGLLGRIVASLVGVAWTVATYLVVPVLVVRNVGPLDAVRDSATLFKRTWGENLIGNGGIGVVFVMLNLLLVAAGVFTVMATVSAGLPSLALMLAIVFVLLLVFSVLVQSSLSGVYSAVLYRYASVGHAPGGFDQALLAGAFVPKR